MMRISPALVLVLLLALVSGIKCGTIGKDDNDHSHKLSGEKHYVDSNNDKKMEHNLDYDHDAFLGKEEAEKFKAMSPEESKKKLGNIVLKIDTDSDGLLSEAELHSWLKNVSHKLLMKQVEPRWQLFGNHTSLDDYIQMHYGTLTSCMSLLYYLNPTLSGKKSARFVSKIDRDRDGFVIEKELRNWIRFQQKYYMQKYTNNKWKVVNTNKDAHLTFDELIENTIGGDDSWTEEEKKERQEDYKTYLKLMERDKKRFKVADSNNDGKLSKSEYTEFLHPELSKAMRELVIDETIEDLDKNKDGVVDLEEFIADYKKDVQQGERSPDMLITEVEIFKTIRDKNGDLVLDREELASWVMPPEYDHTLNEAKHLIYEADENKDGKLSKEEILDNYNLFVASQATAYGQAIYDKEEL